MTNYQMLLERAFSGGYRNPANRPNVVNVGNSLEAQGGNPALYNFAGMATWIPEQSTIQGKFAILYLLQHRKWRTLCL